MQGLIEILKLAACLPFLLYASYADLKSRRVSNRVWKFMIASLSIFVLYEAGYGGSPYIIQLSFSFLFIFALTYLFFLLGGFGGADAKALIVLSFLISVYPEVRFQAHSYPLLGIPFHGLFAFTVFENALLLTAFVPLGILCYNLLHFSRKMLRQPFYMLIAYRVNIAGLRPLVEKGRHIRLIERFQFEEGELRPRFAGSGITISPCILSRLEAHRKDGHLEEGVWIMPGLPFIVSISAGFVTAIVMGDPVWYLILKISGQWPFLI